MTLLEAYKILNTGEIGVITPIMLDAIEMPENEYQKYLKSSIEKKEDIEIKYFIKVHNKIKNIVNKKACKIVSNLDAHLKTYYEAHPNWNEIIVLLFNDIIRSDEIDDKKIKQCLLDYAENFIHYYNNRHKIIKGDLNIH